MTMLPATIESAQDVYRAGGELYHLQCARRVHGDTPVLVEIAADFRLRENLSPGDAFVRAGQFLNDIDRTVARGFGFKQLRARLDAGREAENDAVPAANLSPA
jgi:hypothetical protein